MSNKLKIEPYVLTAPTIPQFIIFEWFPVLPMTNDNDENRLNKAMLLR